MSANTVSDLERSRRFICYGSDSGLLTVGNVPPSREKASSIGRLIDDGKGEEVVKQISTCFGENKYNYKPPLIFALAYCFKSTDNKTKQAACKAFADICLEPTDLFHFVEYSKQMSDQHKGWGRSLRTLISNWYNRKEPIELLDLVTRFKSGCSWSHVDVLRLSHTNPAKDETAIIIKYLMKGLADAKKLATEKKCPLADQIIKYIEAVDIVKHSTDEHQISCLIEQFNLKKEHVPTKMQNSCEIWSALLNNISIVDVLLNVSKLAGLGVLNNGHHLLPALIARLSDENVLKEYGVAPISVLIALRNYEQGKGKLKWPRNEIVANALNTAFYKAIKNNVIPTKKRILIAIKIGYGLTISSVRGTLTLSSMIAAAGVATMFVQSEETASLVYFSSAVKPLVTNKQMDIEKTCDAIAQAALPEIPVLACDVSAPIRWAQETKQSYDAFIILTDSKDSTGVITPSSALQKYRQEMKLPKSKLVICGLTAKHLRFADPNDSGMLDIAGFDAMVPKTISNFLSDN
ncbi:RNA-binding protein RO60 [Patella vulgata]|uniref:RNA-binding protein RO60 n=1 Tax=Patella vulgata TaxID=6465 RepID=UPI0024A8D387|nr:RNA-binding protein RO60 [Patella vulgata]